MRLRGIPILLFLMAGLLSLQAGQAEVDLLFEQSNEAYLREDYQGAIKGYEEILSLGFESGQLYYNLGNAYYKEGHNGMAILNYERALKWLPNDDNVRFNLQLANQQVRDRIDVPPEFFLFRWYDGVVDLFTARQWVHLLAILLLLTAIGFALFWLSDRPRWRSLFRLQLITGGILLILSLPLAIQRDWRETRSDAGIVTAVSVKCHAAPHAGSTELFILHEGTKFSILEEDAGWSKIELIDGKQGWIPQDSRGVI